MKTRTLILGLVACFAWAGKGVVLSQESESLSQERGPGKFKEMVADGDSKFSLDEFLPGAATRFGKLDADEDGFITDDEFKAGRKAVRTQSRERLEQPQGEKATE